MADVELSVVVPVHNEEANLEALWGEIRDAFDDLGLISEVLFVNDGSNDRSSEILDQLRASDTRIRVLDHDRNHGLTAALDCGFQHAHGRLVGMLDADLQNPPADLKTLYEGLGENDVIVGWRKDRDDPWLKLVSSKIANRYRNWRTRESIHDTGCGLKLFRREVLAKIKLYNGLHRFLPTLARMEGFSVVEVPVGHRPRTGGMSHYGVWNRLWKGLADVKAIRWMWANNLTWKATERAPSSKSDAGR